MQQNLFKEIQERKKNIMSITAKAAEFGWITKEREQEIINKLEKEIITIGVIGQMKCGKSTFLNSFVFEDEVLPAATTPMTAALSVITYGEEQKIVAEFYTEEEWEEQKMQASRSLDEVRGNSLEESKIKAAKELVEKSSKLGFDINSLLGKTQEDKFENLIEYVGADGKYISITKSVTIYCLKEYLKGVEIVDTPGFNDPIVSREERTKAFLNKADVVLMMLYAGRPFDATDRDILFDNVRKCGIGRVIVGINKYDIPYERGETEDEIKDYVKEEIRKACKECDDDILVEILRQAEPIPFSAEMALLSVLPMRKITNNEVLKHAWKRACDTFEICSQIQMQEKSHINDLTSSIKLILETEKGEILFAKPINSILAAGNVIKENLEKEIRECDSLITNLSLPDNELDEKLENLNKAERKLIKKIDFLGEELNYIINQEIKKGKRELEDAVDTSCKKMYNIIEDCTVFNISSEVDKINREIQNLNNRTLIRLIQNIETEAKYKVKSEVYDFLADSEDILMRYMPNFDSKTYIKSIVHKIDSEIDEELLKSNKIIYVSNIEYDLSDIIEDSCQLFKNLKQDKLWLRNHISEIGENFDPMKYLEVIKNLKEYILTIIRKDLIEELINPLQAQIKEIRKDFDDKEEKLDQAKEKLGFLNIQKCDFECQFKQISSSV